MYDEGEDLPLHVDFFMTEEQREEDIERLSRSEKAMYDKHELCAEYCDKFLEHIAVMRKDLLGLDSNEDALDLHEEMKGITDVMKLFRIGLDQSVMNQPTQINLADWANLCLFRLAIVRRRVNALKIYIDKTGSAEALVKIEAFLYCVFEYLNTGEIDEYEMEAIEEEEFFDLRFLLDESTIHDPLGPKPEPRPKPPPSEEPDKEEDDEEQEEEEDEDNQDHDDEDEPDKTTEEPDTSEALPASDAEPSADRDDHHEASESTDTPQTTDTPSLAAETSETSESASTSTAAPTSTKSKAQQRVAERRERRARLTKTSGFRANPLTASASGAELLSFYQSQNEKKKKKGKGGEGDAEAPPVEEDTSKAPVGAVRSRLSIFDRMSRSPKPARKKKSGSIRHSTTMIVRRHRPDQQSMSMPLLRGAVQVLTSTNFSAQWKRRWLVLNSEQLEIYKEETCAALVKCYAVSGVTAIHLNGEEELAHEEKSSKKRKAVMEKEFSLLLDFAGDHLHLAPGSRKEQLQWIVALRAIQASTAPPEQALAANLTHIRELYVDHYPTRVTFQLGDEIWTLADGILSSQEGGAVSARFAWDGLTCVTQGESSGFSLTWDGLTLTFLMPAQSPLLFRWVDCRKEFSPLLDEDKPHASWTWRPDQLALHTGEAPEGKTTVSQVWTLTEPAAPPLAMAVACLSNALSGRPLLYESFSRSLPEEAATPISERAELRKKKKDKKKSKKKHKEEPSSPDAATPEPEVTQPEEHPADSAEEVPTQVEEKGEPASETQETQPAEEEEKEKEDGKEVSSSPDGSQEEPAAPVEQQESEDGTKKQEDGSDEANQEDERAADPAPMSSDEGDESA